MGKWCLHASSFIFDWIIIKVADNQDRHISSVEFEFGRNQTTHFGVTCPWVTKISHFWTWISLKPVGQSWSNFMCSIIGVGGRLHKVLGQIDLGTLDSGERSLPFGILVAEEQTGFRAGRSTTEQKFDLRILCEKYLQHQHNLPCLHRLQEGICQGMPRSQNHSRVRQGVLLLPTLFNIFLERTMCEALDD